MTTKETEIEFCLSGLPRQVNGKGEVLPAIGYCTKITRHKVKREVEGEIMDDPKAKDSQMELAHRFLQELEHRLALTSRKEVFVELRISFS